MQTFDVVVIGAGPGGEVLAGRLSQAGRAVAIVEAELIGGECSFYACMPSKALLAPIDALDEARRVPGAAEAITGELDVAAVLARRDEVIGRLNDAGQVPWLTDRGVTIVRGQGRLDGERRVTVGDDVLVAREAVVVATGSAAVIPPIPGLAEAHPWTNREITTSERVPERLVIIGGGVVGVEMADAYASLGSRVTIVDPAMRLIAREEPFASAELEHALAERGIDVFLEMTATGIVRDDSGVHVELRDGTVVDADEVLVAAGRHPRTDDIGMETVGLRPGDALAVDDRLSVPGQPWLFAIGDVNGLSLFTHMAKHQAMIVADILLGLRRSASLDDGAIPRVVFTELQIAAVGLTLDAALAEGLQARAYDVPTSGTAGAVFRGRGTPGTSRLVVDERRGVVVGATFTGADVAEWLHAATIAVVGRVPIERLWEAIPAFPTRSEVWLTLLQQRETVLAHDGDALAQRAAG